MNQIINEVTFITMPLEVPTIEDFKRLEEQLTRIEQMLSGKTEHSSWLRSRDVKKRLGVNDSSLQSYRKSGRLKYKRVGKTYHYTPESVEELFQVTRN